MNLWPNIDVRFRGGNGNLYTGYDELKNGGLCPHSPQLPHPTGKPKTGFSWEPL